MRPNQKRTMKQMLNDYIGRIKPLLAAIDGEPDMQSHSPC